MSAGPISAKGMMDKSVAGQEQATRDGVKSTDRNMAASLQNVRQGNDQEQASPPTGGDSTPASPAAKASGGAGLDAALQNMSKGKPAAPDTPDTPDAPTEPEVPTE